MLSVMQDTLTYFRDSPVPRRWSCLLMLLGPILLSACGAPENKPSKEADVRGAAMQSQINAEMDNTNQLLNEGNFDDAAKSAFCAEFSLQTEADSLSKSQYASFKRRLAEFHGRLETLYAPVQKGWEMRIAEMKRKRELQRLQPSNVIIDYVDLEMIDKFRKRTVADLEIRAKAELKAGDDNRAQEDCLKILFLDPIHRFGVAFWADRR